MSGTIYHFHSNSTTIIILFKKREAGTEAILRYQCVGIEEQHILTPGLFQTGITCFGKPKIFFFLNKMYFRKFWLQVFKASIRRTVVNYNHLRFYALTSLAQREKTLLKEVLDIIIDYDDG